MNILLSTAAAIAFLVLVLALHRRFRSREPDEIWQGPKCATNLCIGHWVDLSECIFNPADARWLREELAFPQLARDLELQRRRLAIHWLRALRASFNQLVQTPDLVASGDENSAGHWRMLWLTFRFNGLILYALAMVGLFGPYHRLVPSFSWLPLPGHGEPRFRRPAMADSRGPR